ncbi:hypothetical protein BMS3Abin10_00647 [bacterium BMS3Abin10]|nr:hypothetical protein BMS3Abin10_00647 [bacterium BMS3Abin10]GBE38799.1 hypothetical protein BMS3Bbin08_01411 [bacterium BMS3Bbin08]
MIAKFNKNHIKQTKQGVVMRIIRSLLTVAEVFGATGLLLFKKIKPAAGVVLMLFLFSTAAVVAAENVMPYDNLEEEADTVMPLDEIITGNVSEYSKNNITLDGAGYYNLCRALKVFSENGRDLSFKDLDQAEQVKIFLNRSRNCVRKIKFLRSAQ